MHDSNQNNNMFTNIFLFHFGGPNIDVRLPFSASKRTRHVVGVYACTKLLHWSISKRADTDTNSHAHTLTHTHALMHLQQIYSFVVFFYCHRFSRYLFIHCKVLLRVTAKLEFSSSSQPIRCMAYILRNTAKNTHICI